MACAADAVVAAARALRRPAAAFRGDGDSTGDAGTNLAALDDACQLASEALPAAARAGLLDDVGDGTRTTLHDATRELVSALAAVAGDAADAAMAEARRARDAADARVEGGAAGDAARDDEMFDDDLDAMPASRAMDTRNEGGAPSTYLATQLTRATPPSAQTLPSVGASPDGAEAGAGANAADAAALAALAAVSAIGATFPAAAAAAAAALLERVVEPVEARPPEEDEEDEEDEEQTEGMVCVLVGGERVADAATRALCALSGTDASEEPSAIGAKGAGVADLADRAIAGLEAALVGPSGRGGADDAVDRAPEERRAWLLTQTAALAEGLLRRRQRRRRRGRRRAGDPSAAAATAVAARRRGIGPRDVASVAAESSQTARLYPRLRFLVEDIAGLPDCVDLENNGVGDATKFAPASLRAPASRAALSRALRALLELDPDYFQPPLAGALVALLEDGSGAVRRAAGRIARVLAVFEPSDQPGILREKIARRLCLCVALPEPDALGRSTREDEKDDDEDDHDEHDEHAAAQLVGGAAAAASAAACKEETAMLALGHLAAACPAVEARCVFLLLAHAASKARDGAQNACGTPRASVVALAAGILSRLAEALGYGSRRAFLTRHARTVGALWIRAEMSPHRLFRLFDVRPAGSTTQPRRDVLAGGRLARLRAAEADAWERAIVPPAVLAGDARAVRAASDAHWRRVGRGDVANTVRSCIAPVVAHLFLACSLSSAEVVAPDSADPESSARAVARSRLAEAAASALEGPLLARAGTEKRGVDVLAFGSLATIAAEMMLLTQCPHDGDAVRAPSPPGRVDSSCAEAEALAPPYRTPDEVVRAGLALPEAARKGLASGAAGRVASARNQPSDAPSAWTGDAAHRCVAALHAELCASRHPRHRKRAFAGLEVARRVLGNDAYRPSTARQLCHVALPTSATDVWVPGDAVLEGVFGGPSRGATGPPSPTAPSARGGRGRTRSSPRSRRRRRRGARRRARPTARRRRGDQASRVPGRRRGRRRASRVRSRRRRRADAAAEAPGVAQRGGGRGARARDARRRCPIACAPGARRAWLSRRARALRDGIREALERSREICEAGASAARDAWRLAALAADAGDASLVARAGELLATLGPFATEGRDDDERRKTASATSGKMSSPSSTPRTRRSPPPCSASSPGSCATRPRRRRAPSRTRAISSPPSRRAPRREARRRLLVAA